MKFEYDLVKMGKRSSIEVLFMCCFLQTVVKVVSLQK